MESRIEDHTRRVKEHLADGRKAVASLRAPDIRAYDVPDLTADRSVLYRHLPLEGDKFYIATDERDIGNLTYLAENDAVLVYDLLTIEDRHSFGWPLMFTDVLAVVEQATLARAAFFYAHAMSSVAGGVINLRVGFLACFICTLSDRAHRLREEQTREQHISTKNLTSPNLYRHHLHALPYLEGTLSN